MLELYIYVWFLIVVISGQSTLIDHGCTLADPAGGSHTYHINVNDIQDGPISCRQDETWTAQLNSYEEKVGTDT